MMKLSTMKKVMDTVDSEWRSPLGELILEKWGYDEGTVFILRASANFIFVFKKDGKQYYLRFNDSCERDLSTIEAELNIVQYLGSKCLHVAQPIKSLNGEYIETVKTEIGTFYAVVFEAIKGKHYDFEEITSDQAYLWGKSLGALHENLKQLPEEYKINRPSWRENLLKVKEILPSNETVAKKELERIVKWAEGLNISKENFGIIHYDFELDNLVFAESTIGMLDFDDSSLNWYVADIVYALRDAGDFNIKHSIITNFIQGYESETLLDMQILKETLSLRRCTN
ncbi:phosphotransferase [Anaerobacillus sp. CMMVII]|uniref:phosphotransferase enzyme family protein n=1 Tax=Anaerobacillus sp. CMMVII TaxID=2755588 RepID=UPI0021B74866|nr:phosphotransferase [Anaerobacillus sp. CMMVII]MCT8140518.1 phosphotransferase [Anaerobacillus sp. CMMVII]